MSEARFPVESGSYLLWLYLPQRRDISIGRLGCHSFRRGWYGYCGSAFGPGGLQARLRHHLRPAERCHWHIDYFKERAGIRSVWLCRGSNLEHRWSELLLQRPGAQVAVPGFGASDCHCSSHLVYLPSRAQVQQSFSPLAGISNIYRYNCPSRLCR